MQVIHKQALAEQDLVHIWLYSYHQWGKEQADRYLDELENNLQTLANQPHLGRERSEFTPTVRTHLHAHHLIVYQIIKDGITVIRVLHESMNIHEPGRLTD